MKKLLAIFLSVLLLTACLPLGAISVSAVDECAHDFVNGYWCELCGALPTSGITGDCTWRLDGTHLTISGNGAMEGYYIEVPAPWYWSQPITSVTIENGVTAIGSFAFVGAALTSLTIPDSVTYIGWGAFRSCRSLTSVTIPDSVTTIAYEAFSNCDSLTSVTIPDSVTTIGYEAFSYCDALTSVTIGDGLTTIGSDVFYNCDALNSVTIGSSVTTIEWDAFYDCDSLKFIEVDENNPNYCDVDGVLFNKSKTTLVQYPNGKSGNYIIPDSVTTIGNCAFSYRTSLTSVIIPDSVITIEDSALSNCDSLTSVTIPDSVAVIGTNAFAYCDSLTSIEVDENNPNYCDVDGVLFNKSRTVLVQYPAGKSGAYTIPDGVTTIGERAFCDCASLTSVTIPNSVTAIGESAFSGCDSLIVVTIPGSITTIGKKAFYDCDSLISVTIPDSVTTIGERAFSSCASLTSVTIGNRVTTIENGAFDYCKSLTTVHYHGTRADKAAISIGSYNDNLTSAIWHYYDDACDAICNDCGERREVATLYGDLNGDGGVNARDLVLLQQYMAGWDVTFILAAADVDGDDRVVARDLALLQQYVAGWNVTLG